MSSPSLAPSAVPPAVLPAEREGVPLAEREAVPPIQRWPVLAALALALFTAAMTFPHGGWRLVAATGIGLFAGVALYHAAFGFTGAWRRIVLEGRGGGLRAQMLLLALTCAVSLPLIAFGRPDWLGGGGVGGFVFPFGVAVAFGAFLFGVGMQFGGGCGSGTLFTAGGGSSRMVVTLAAFIAGSVLGTLHVPWWNTMPAFPAVSLVDLWGPWGALAASMALFAAIYALALGVERRRHGTFEPLRAQRSWLRGTWSPWTGAVAIALVGIATFAVLGRPWGVTNGFAIWGAKLADAAGLPIRETTFWSWGFARAWLDQSVFADATSVMNFGIVAGAMLAAGLASKYRPTFRLSGAELATAIVGGLLMGYGARLSFGCNIGAYLGGIASGSLHGWFWAVFAFAGSSGAALVKRRRGW